MKTRTTLYFLAFLILLSNYSCKKSDSIAPSKPSGNDSSSNGSTPPLNGNPSYTQVNYTGTTSLSSGRQNLVASAIDNKIVFAGGLNSNSYFSTVDIFDVTTSTWTNTQLSAARENLAAASAPITKSFLAEAIRMLATHPMLIYMMRQQAHGL